MLLMVAGSINPCHIYIIVSVLLVRQAASGLHSGVGFKEAAVLVSS